METRLSATTASAALHAAVLLTLFSIMSLSNGKELGPPISTLLPQHLVWVPHDGLDGGGRDSGGEQSRQPVRRAQAIGSDAVTVATLPQQLSTDANSQPPDDVSTLPAKPMGDATQALAGAIEGTGTSSGPGSSEAGTVDGVDRGALGKQGDGFGPGALRNGPGVTIPTLVERVAPRYTVDAMRAQIEGAVWVECVVMPDGSVGDARVMRSLDRRFGLDDEAIAAAKRWRFRPGLLNGRPVPVVITIELTFSVR